MDTDKHRFYICKRPKDKRHIWTRVNADTHGSRPKIKDFSLHNTNVGSNEIITIFIHNIGIRVWFQSADCQWMKKEKGEINGFTG
jgi:hypothetical protein